MKGGEAGRDAAGIRLHIEAVSDSPNGDRETVRDEDESHVRKESVIDPLAVGRFVDGTSGSESGVRASGEQETIMHNNAASQRAAGKRESAAKTMFGGTSMCSQGSAAAAPRAFFG